jgi:hypothetical protein
LEQAYGSLRRAAPNKLAVLTVAVLHVGVTAGVFQATIFESAVDEHPIIENNVLAFKGYLFVPSHLSPLELLAPLPFPLVFCLRLSHGLPLHIARVIGPSTSERLPVVDYVAGTRP